MIKWLILFLILIACLEHRSYEFSHSSEPLIFNWKDYTPGLKTEPATKICNGIRSKVLIEKELWALKENDCLIIKD
jgi:hypothetical protein